MVEGLENHEDDGKRVVVVRFPSMEVAKEWYSSPEYVAARELRKDAGFARFMVAEGFEG